MHNETVAQKRCGMRFCPGASTSQHNNNTLAWRSGYLAMAVTGAARTARRVRGCMYMRTPIDAQVHAPCCAALHPRLSAPHNPPGISVWPREPPYNPCESVRILESNRGVCPVEVAVGVWVVMETSGQGGLRVENIAPGARRRASGPPLCMRGSCTAAGSSAR